MLFFTLYLMFFIPTKESIFTFEWPIILSRNLDSFSFDKNTKGKEGEGMKDIPKR